MKIATLLLIISGLLGACKGSSTCLSPTPQECMTQLFFDVCVAGGEELKNLQTACDQVMKQSCGTRELALVPELAGGKNLDRYRGDVCGSARSLLHVPTSTVSYAGRLARNQLAYLNRQTLRQLAPSSSGALQQAVAPNPNLPPTDNKYTETDIGKVIAAVDAEKAAWDANGTRVESCDEYVYEKFYDFSRLKDLILQSEGAGLVDAVASAFHSASEQGTSGVGGFYHYSIPHPVPAGEVGTLGLDVLANKNYADLIRRKGDVSTFKEHVIQYSADGVASKVQNVASPDLDPQMIFEKHPLAAVSTNRPKNLFHEVLGWARKNVSAQTASGLAITDPNLTAILSQGGFDKSSTGVYLEDWEFHFRMLRATQKKFPDRATLGTKLHEAALLRRHLLQLLADRAAWESRILAGPGFDGIHTKDVLDSLKTPSLTEKSRALDAYQDRRQALAASFPGMLSYSVVLQRLASLDQQIQKVLNDARALGCLDMDGTSYLYRWDKPNFEDRLGPNDNYTKALCDWSPDLFTEKVVTLLPDALLEKEHGECTRLTAGDVSKLKTYTFPFPSKCAGNAIFSLWSPNAPQDHTKDTQELRFFGALAKEYPNALLACDGLIRKETLDKLHNAGLNYFDPITKQILMSHSRSSYDREGGDYLGIELGYTFGWSFEGYDNIGSGTGGGDIDPTKVCSQTNGFGFGNYFVNGTFLKKDFTLLSTGSYASNRTVTGTPGIPSLASDSLRGHIADDLALHGGSGQFLFIKDQHISKDDPLKLDSESVDGTSGGSCPPHHLCLDRAVTTQVIKFEMTAVIPVCPFISVQVKGALSGNVGASTKVDEAIWPTFDEQGKCKMMSYAFKPELSIDGFAQAAVTAGIPGVAAVSAGVEIGVRFVGLSFPFDVRMEVSNKNGAAEDVPFHYDIWTKTWSNLDVDLSLLSGTFALFARVEYLIDSTTFRKTLFSWDGFHLGGNLDHVASEAAPFTAPLRALYGLSTLMQP